MSKLMKNKYIIYIKMLRQLSNTPSKYGGHELQYEAFDLAHVINE